ncbi:protein LURP-one-related 5 [Cryptomeria japonica]|uniref:protein LURP-one-related 5 n=1 Tax=Cryptomeria japonica TaxID=3369 RepID=UPI0025AD70AC|nr:protein LURP-one-related 5 [Cryptomeria japonica]
MSQICPQSEDLPVQVVVDQQFCCATATALTVWNKSLLFSGEGFTVFDSNGDLLFRVDTYAFANNNLVLMDAQGKPLLTLCRKLPSLHQRWEGFLGDKLDGQKPLFTVRKSSILPSKECVQVFMNCGFFWKPCADYEIEGSFSQRSCTIFTSAPRMAAAEVKRKCGSGGYLLGTDVFSLCIEPGFDQAFIMGLIIVLEQIFPGECELPLVKMVVDEMSASHKDQEITAPPSSG